MKKSVIIDGNTAVKKENMKYRGFGMVSANNSSRLLIDYKWEQPQKYAQILEHIFGKDGLNISHLKIEMGSDINSSSGTEPSVMRYKDETADVTRGAGFQLAFDSKKINPGLTLDMLFWSEPRWVSDSDDVNAARYDWYKNTLDMAYRTYGIKFDYVSVVQNERAADYEWIKYFAKRLKSEKDCPYDYSKIKIVGGEEVCTWWFAEVMKDDEELKSLIDVVGSHYTSSSTITAQNLALNDNKELWLSEGSSPASYTEGVYRFDGSGSGMSDINGCLDIANRIIAMYPNGKMTLYEFQPVVAAYYDGVTYCHKQLINAAYPWNGYYTMDSGFYISLHFSRFFKKGWEFIDSACFCDGKAGGDGHAIVDANFSYMTAADPISGDFSMVIVNSSAEECEYSLKIKNLKKASFPLNIIETCPPEGKNIGENYFCQGKPIIPKPEDDGYICSIKVKPYSIVTLSTLENCKKLQNVVFCEKNSPLALPYYDDFNYENYPVNYLSSRGNAPRYTTDQGGAFEVVKSNGGNLLMQKITSPLKAKEWGYTPEPLTSFGDDRWLNYRISVNVNLVKSNDKEKSYAGAGIRYTLACESYSGYYIKLFEDGLWQFYVANDMIYSGKLDEFCLEKSHMVTVSACDDKICGYVNGEKIFEHKSPCGELIGGGRAVLVSSYHQNSFSDLKLEPLAENYTVTRFDNTDSCFNYSTEWQHQTMSSFANYKRTLSSGKKGCTVTIDIEGDSFYLFGKTQKAVVELQIDDTASKTIEIPECQSRRVSLKADIPDSDIKTSHKVKITVLDGEYSLDGIEIIKKRD